MKGLLMLLLAGAIVVMLVFVGGCDPIDQAVAGTREQWTQNLSAPAFTGWEINHNGSKSALVRGHTEPLGNWKMYLNNSVVATGSGGFAREVSLQPGDNQIVVEVCKTYSYGPKLLNLWEETRCSQRSEGVFFDPGPSIGQRFSEFVDNSLSSIGLGIYALGNSNWFIGVLGLLFASLVAIASPDLKAFAYRQVWPQLGAQEVVKQATEALRRGNPNEAERLINSLPPGYQAMGDGLLNRIAGARIQAQVHLAEDAIARNDFDTATKILDGIPPAYRSMTDRVRSRIQVARQRQALSRARELLRKDQLTECEEFLRTTDPADHQFDQVRQELAEARMRELSRLAEAEERKKIQQAVDALGATYYEILGVSPTATSRVVKIAYRRLARKYHPDLKAEGYERNLATACFKRVNEANETLSDDIKRAAYDQELRTNDILDAAINDLGG